MAKKKTVKKKGYRVTSAMYYKGKLVNPNIREYYRAVSLAAARNQALRSNRRVSTKAYKFRIRKIVQVKLWR